MDTTILHARHTDLANLAPMLTLANATEALTFASLASVIVGLMLWLMGQKIARQSIAVSGLLIGGLIAFPFSQHFGADARITLAWVVGGAVAGCLIAWLLFRLWMGISMGAILAITMPITVLAWQGAPLPFMVDDEGVEASAAPHPRAAPVVLVQESDEDAGDASDDADDGDTDDGDEPSSDSPTLRGADALNLDLPEEQRKQIEAAEAQFFATVQDVYEAKREEAIVWWDLVGEPNHNKIIGSCSAGALIGLLLGLGFPTFSATFQSALLGSLLLVGGARGFLQVYSQPESDSVLTSHQANLVTVGLITTLGVLLQWMIWRKQTDK